jgi:glycosyltransferase involved in cell wall biosynthesis
MNLENLTIIVPTKNEARNIEAFLGTVPFFIRIIIVDASTDRTCEIIHQKKRKNVTIIKDDGNIAMARQIGAEAAMTEWLLFSDADVGFGSDYFTRLHQMDLCPLLGGVVGAKHSRDRYRWYYYFFSQWLNLCCAMGIPAGSGSNMLVNRNALLAVGGFDCNLSCNEDTDLTWRLHRKGYRIAYHGRLKVYEFDHRRLDRGLWRKTLHSVIRCAILVLGLRGVLHKNDWGYWQIGNANHTADGRQRTVI